MWMDHRAITEAQQITDSNFEFLKNFGGICSPEFSISKLAWMHKNQFDRFSKAEAFLELPDWLVWRSTQSTENSCHLFPRSMCCIGCKWAFDTEANRWSPDFFRALNVQNVSDVKRKIGENSCAPGTFVGNLTVEAAIEMGLLSENNTNTKTVSISVSSSLIDAHSGVLAMFALHAKADCDTEQIFESVVCVIAGTSTCHMALSKQKLFTRGVWGPYFNVIFLNSYLREAGQSAAGKLIDFLIKQHEDLRTTYKHLTYDDRFKNEQQNQFNIE
ncbi:FGGY carbohydrate kinase domain-containing-like protein [Leptotrombidium deliense]|uniref:FGGY carbohydrate kinase domain-containing-like protein n=1 Tax=Leptotrombidium deliense TaxID=299467 RepID=A0A443SKX4_9ACAR|nr:FGGY carbohydrate kinase domain-containing-like protein [Leptotrombidium deliense]